MIYAIQMLVYWYHTLNKTLRGVGKNSWPCLCLNSPFFLSNLSSQIWLWLKCWLISEGSFLHSNGMESVVMLWECWYTVTIPPTNLQQVWAPMLWPAFASTHHSHSTSCFLRFDLCWSTGQFLSGSSKQWWHGMCCNATWVLVGCYPTLNKPPTGVGNNNWPCLHLNSPFWVLHKLFPRIWLWLKCCWPISEWF